VYTDATGTYAHTAFPYCSASFRSYTAVSKHATFTATTAATITTVGITCCSRVVLCISAAAYVLITVCYIAQYVTIQGSSNGMNQFLWAHAERLATFSMEQVQTQYVCNFLLTR
jgi:hypothetical protein